MWLDQVVYRMFLHSTINQKSKHGHSKKKKVSMVTRIEIDLGLQACPLWCLLGLICRHGSTAKRLFSSLVLGGIWGHCCSGILKVAALLCKYWQRLFQAPILFHPYLYDWRLDGLGCCYNSCEVDSNWIQITSIERCSRKWWTAGEPYPHRSNESFGMNQSNNFQKKKSVKHKLGVCISLLVLTVVWVGVTNELNKSSR